MSKYKKSRSGFSLIELLVAGAIGVIIIIALATALDVAWIYYQEVSRYNRVDSVIAAVDRYISRKVINAKGGYYWMPTGTKDMIYFYSNQGAESISAEGQEINSSGNWLRIEDFEFFNYALMEGFTDVHITSREGIKYAILIDVDKVASKIKLKTINEEPIWINRGDIIEIARKLSYLELKNGKLWSEQEGYIADGIVGIDILYTIRGKSGYGITELTDPEYSQVVCSYDANEDGMLTVDDDLNKDSNLDCIEVEPAEQTKFDGIQYWILAKLPSEEASRREAPLETFVVGRNIYQVARNYYPRILTKKINFGKFEL